MDLRAYCELERGNQQRLADGTGLDYGYINQIVNGRRPIPIEHAAKIEELTGGMVTRKEMFPYKWKRIWPELAKVNEQTDKRKPTR